MCRRNILTDLTLCSGSALFALLFKGHGQYSETFWLDILQCYMHTKLGSHQLYHNFLRLRINLNGFYNEVMLFKKLGTKLQTLLTLVTLLLYINCVWHHLCLFIMEH